MIIETIVAGTRARQSAGYREAIGKVANVWTWLIGWESSLHFCSFDFLPCFPPIPRHAASPCNLHCYRYLGTVETDLLDLLQSAACQIWLLEPDIGTKHYVPLGMNHRSNANHTYLFEARRLAVKRCTYSSSWITVITSLGSLWYRDQGDPLFLTKMFSSYLSLRGMRFWVLPFDGLVYKVLNMA